MFIITRFELTPAHLKRVGEQLGLTRAATQDEAREFMQREGEQTLDALTLPLMAGAQSRRSVRPVAVSR